GCCATKVHALDRYNPVSGVDPTPANAFARAGSEWGCVFFDPVRVHGAATRALLRAACAGRAAVRHRLRGAPGRPGEALRRTCRGEGSRFSSRATVGTGAG